MSSIKFSILSEIGLMRAGVLETPHGKIETPAFVAVGTKASVKALTTEQVKDLGAQVVLANTYHLYLEPGAERLKSFGGLHRFMNWQGPIMTDSGGFQAFSLGRAFGKSVSKVASEKNQKGSLSAQAGDADENSFGRLAEVTEDGVTFKSHLDGSLHHITPEKSMEIQHNLGADIIFAFDECTSPQESFEYQKEAMARTHRWAKRSLEYHRAHNNGEQALFGIVQGGREESLRKESAEFIGNLDFDGFGIGGSFNKEDMATAVRWVNEILPKEKPKHLLGIGEPEDLFMGIENGVDLFDCVAPTRNGRGGTLYTKNGKMNIRNAEFRDDQKPVEESCGCYTCKNYSRGYLCHLYRAHEILGGTLGSIHNLYFIVNLVKKIRESIIENTFDKFKKEFLTKYKA